MTLLNLYIYSDAGESSKPCLSTGARAFTYRPPHGLDALGGVIHAQLWAMPGRPRRWVRGRRSSVCGWRANKLALTRLGLLPTF